jgi:hypothetical protein
MSLRSLLSAGALVASVASFAACADVAPMGVADDHSAHLSAPSTARGRDGAAIGTTLGWGGGKVISFHYNKPFFCAEPTASLADSKCKLGEEPAAAPRPGKVPVLYVTVPLFALNNPQTLQCPVAGDCINHPSTFDLTAIEAIVGPGAGNALLPAHSHVVGDDDVSRQGPNAGWWEIEVVGVPSQAAWDELVAGRSLRTIRALQSRGAVTGDIPTNLFLFFSVNKSGV